MKSAARKTLHPLFIVPGLLILVIGLAYASSRFTAQKATVNEVTSSGTVALYASPSSLMLRPTAQKSMAISIVSETNRVTAIQLEVEYDPAKLTLSDFTNSGIFATTLSAPTNTNGVVKATFAAAPDTGGISGNPGAVAWYKVTMAQPGTTAINFGPNTLVSVAEKDTNDLKEVHNATVQALYPGDINGDNKVDIFDYNKFVVAYNNPSSYNADLSDLTTNGTIDIFDYNKFVANYGKTYP